MKRIVYIIFLAVCIGVQAVELSIPRQDAYPIASSGVSLDGVWRFRMLDGTKFTDGDSLFYRADYDDSAWDSIVVPSNWEIAGVKEPEYGGDVRACMGLYRRHFEAPRLASGEHLMLRFEGVLFAYDVYINGRYVGYWASSFNPWQFDITDYIHEGPNTIAVCVSTRSRTNSYRFDLNDCWALTGIFRSVWLWRVTPTHLRDITFRTSLDGQEADVWCRVDLHSFGQHQDHVEVAVSLMDPSGNTVLEKLRSIDVNDTASVIITARISQPSLWTAETPTLYTLRVRLMQEGRALQEAEERVGVREVQVVGDRLLLNGRAITMRGVCMNELHPEVGRAMTEELMRRDIEMIQRANINYVRTAHYPFSPRFLELCDEYGLYVVSEIPFGYGDSNLGDSTYLWELCKRAEATITRDKNHPATIIWTVGNENPYTPIVEQTLSYVRMKDPTRPRALPGMKQSNVFVADSISDDVSLYTLHYQSIDKIEKMVSLHRKPILLTEYAHALGLSFDALESQQAMIRRHPEIAGGSVWVWADQALLRERTAAECLADTIPQGIWMDSTHYYDSYNDKGTDGIVYANRYPQEDYYQVRKLYSPVWIADSVLHVGAGKQSVLLTVENRYDFLSLTSCVLRWQLRDMDRVLQKGQSELHAAAQTTEQVALSLRVPGRCRALMVAVEVSDARGRVVYEHTLPVVCREAKIQTESTSPLSLEVTESGKVVLTDRKGKEYLNSELLLRMGRRPSINLVNLIQRRKLDSYWMPYIMYPVVEKIEPLKDGYRVHCRWNRENGANGDYVEGHVDLQIDDAGQLMVDYDLRSRHADGTILEAGLALCLPETETTFTWLGDGIYSSTPHKSALNEYGLYSLHRDDHRFIGNRGNVRWALFCHDGAKTALRWMGSQNLSVENVEGRIIATDVRYQSSYGTKLSRMMVQIKAHRAKQLQGHFILSLISTKHLPTHAEAERPMLKTYEH